MSQARTTFDDAIRDAEELLAHFDKPNTQPPPENAEVLRRAGLIMAFTTRRSDGEGAVGSQRVRPAPAHLGCQIVVRQTQILGNR